jgi:2-dehydro-3-deoxyphosphooctonate aldolase (KDO 8-P synthase)
MSRHVKAGNVTFGNDLPLTLIAGPCQMESQGHALEVAGTLVEMTKKLSIGLVYKTSYDKANRTSLSGKRGMGLEKSLAVFDEIKKTFGVPTLTDVHEITHCALLAPHVDILQIPAFLCRQTDLLIAAAKTGKVINVKKGQFLCGFGQSEYPAHRARRVVWL